MTWNEPLLRSAYKLADHPVAPTAEDKPLLDRLRLKRGRSREDIDAVNAAAVRRNLQELIRKFPHTSVEDINAHYNYAERFVEASAAIAARCSTKEQSLQILKEQFPDLPDDLYRLAIDNGVRISYF